MSEYSHYNAKLTKNTDLPYKREKKITFFLILELTANRHPVWWHGD